MTLQGYATAQALGAKNGSSIRQWLEAPNPQVTVFVQAEGVPGALILNANAAASGDITATQTKTGTIDP